MKTLKAVIAIILCVACTVSVTGCLKYTDNILTVTKAMQPNEVSGADNTYSYETLPVNDVTVTAPQNDVSVPETTSPQVVTPVQDTTAAEPTPVTPEQTTAAAQEKNPSQWTKAEILAYVTAAVNKSKAYNGKLTVGHKESFDVKIDNISVGGSLIQNTANQIINSVAKPTNETLTFVNGKTTTSEGETVPILLPKRQNFALTIDGLASATASKSGNNTVINLTIVQENTTIGNPVPKHNAASCGYMSLADVDLPGIVTVSKLDMKYTGSTIKLTVNDKGYVASCTYSIPVIINGSGKVGISADFQVTAKIVEVWNLNW